MRRPQTLHWLARDGGLLMDEIIKTIILGAPNVAVAVAALYWASRLIERMVAAQEKLADQLLDLCSKNEELVETLRDTKLPAPQE
jgi:hypothetical protein